MVDEERTTASLRSSTMHKIRRLGVYGETVDDIVTRALDHYIRTTHKDRHGKFDGKSIIKRGLLNNGKRKKG